MSDSKSFNRGDWVLHPRRPEWGEGVVEEVTNINHEGRPAQRLIVKFANHGLATINTGLAPLVRKEHSAAVGAAAGNGRGNNGWLNALGTTKPPTDELTKLPDAMTDPFVAVNKRIQATLDSYRYAGDARNPRTLLDWAVAQTGLQDPLSKYTRHELEQAFPRFARDRENHLFELVRQVKRAGQQYLLQEIKQATTHPLSKDALNKAMAR